ncbi:carboxymuconolactone decarboxylase family protein [Streptomyces sp. NA04227]|uniref:carboxymuconolactone decarboxylase family protein n=1 Tax=Streptomyces sp. NA04227 TaxID=2742136 RepID=UPI00159288C9|nr:carboxymuconolactone decarboxylase family protein [Streptomyces sp. NA04227]QKW09881.1 carboxymuconolactone decarboxylase family protein [Streptomyces sp. NA04227]
MSAPRIRPGRRAETGFPIWAFSALAGRVTGTEPPALFRVLGRNRRLFWGWLRFAGRLMPGGRLPRRESELVILRVAHLRECAYEFAHHVRLGRRAGVTAADVERVRKGPGATGWTERELSLLNATDALLGRGDLDETEWNALRAHLDDAATIELLLLVGHYDMLATTLRVLRLEPDRTRRAEAPKT